MRAGAGVFQEVQSGWGAVFCGGGDGGGGVFDVFECGWGGSVRVFGWFLRLCTVSGFVAWVVLLGAHLVCRFSFPHFVPGKLLWVSRARPLIRLTPFF